MTKHDSITGENLEAAAKAAFEAFWSDTRTLDTWEAQPKGYKRNWYRVVRAVLKADKRTSKVAEQERAA